MIGPGMLGMEMVVEMARFITAAATGFGSDSLVTTLVADTSEFMIGAGTLSEALVTVLQTSAKSCSCVVLTSSTGIGFAVVVVVVVLVLVSVMLVLTDGMIGMMGMTTRSSTPANSMPVLEVNTTQLQLFADVCSTVTSAPESVPAPIMNSLVSATKVVTNESLPNPVAAAVMNLAIPSIPGPIMSINTTDVIEDCAEDKGNMSEPLEDDAVIENDLEQQQLDKSAEKRKPLEIYGFVATMLQIIYHYRMVKTQS
ncbi:conserved hypothetical protein [Culex quinquefasciatus]|uniref:Uncharacterized protein n=1 Tax=Culex quinquefasciatus TaxID=7176 RepID=B0WU04_CULQU|nr:conserved hypothetical protein [Culex quinquefasciatus]|eukprot:XP_001857257.1 conserved hypothetical protein [Culex quinquefasciatus]